MASPDLPRARSSSRSVGLRLLLVPSPRPLFSRISCLLRADNESPRQLSPPARRRGNALGRAASRFAEWLSRPVEAGARKAGTAPIPAPAAQDRTRFIPRERSCVAPQQGEVQCSPARYLP